MPSSFPPALRPPRAGGAPFTVVAAKAPRRFPQELLRAPRGGSVASLYAPPLTTPIDVDRLLRPCDRLVKKMRRVSLLAHRQNYPDCLRLLRNFVLPRC